MNIFVGVPEVTVERSPDALMFSRVGLIGRVPSGDSWINALL